MNDFNNQQPNTVPQEQPKRNPQMKPCKRCGTMLYKGTKVCHSCGAKVGKFKKGCGCSIGIVLVFLILVIVIGSSDSNSDIGDDNFSENSSIVSTSSVTVTESTVSNSASSKNDSKINENTETDTHEQSKSTFDSESYLDKDTESEEESTVESQSYNAETSSKDKTNVTTDSDFMLELNPEGFGAIDTTGLKLEFGDLLSVNNGGDGVVVVKAKIKPSYSNKATIEQNYYTVCDLIQNHGFDTCTELQYWAVADMTDGSESKVISFTVNSDTIQTIKGGNFPDNLLGDYVDDLYILPSLKD